MTDYKEFFDNLNTDEMPVMDKILKKIEGYIEVERVSDEEALDESNHISFSLKIKEFKDSLIKISSTKDDSDISETEVYSYINGDWVNILFNNSLYLKYYGKSYFKNDNKWRKAITFGSLLDGKVNGDNLIDIINLYISKKLNFHNDEMYVYDRIRVNDMSEIDHLDDLVYHKDLKNVNDIDKNRSNKLLFDLAFNMSTTYYIDYRFYLDGYMRDMMIDLIDNKNAAIRRSIKCGEYNAILFPNIERDDIYPLMFNLIAHINKNKEYFRHTINHVLSLCKNYNFIWNAINILIYNLAVIVYRIDDYEEYIDKILFDDPLQYTRCTVGTVHEITPYRKEKDIKTDSNDYKIFSSYSITNIYHGFDSDNIITILHYINNKEEEFPIKYVFEEVDIGICRPVGVYIEKDKRIIKYNNVLFNLFIFDYCTTKEIFHNGILITGGVFEYVKFRNY